MHISIAREYNDYLTVDIRYLKVLKSISLLMIISRNYLILFIFCGFADAGEQIEELHVEYVGTLLISQQLCLLR